jgi:hypothetical protein
MPADYTTWLSEKVINFSRSKHRLLTCTFDTANINIKQPYTYGCINFTALDIL